MGKSRRKQPAQVRILQKRSGQWINLYPEHQGELPPVFGKTEAGEKVKRMSETFGIDFKIMPAKRALKFEIPKRW